MPGTIVLVAMAAALWGANFNLSHIVLTDMHPLSAGAGRFAMAALFMLALAGLRGERVPLAREARSFGALGVVGVAGFNLLFFWAMTMTSPVNGALIMATNPLVTSLMAAVVLSERPSARLLLALPLAFAGVAAVVLGGQGGSLRLAPGDALMLAANLCWAGYNVLGRRMMPRGSALTNAAGIMTVGASVLVAAAVFSGAPLEMPGAAAGSALVAMALGGTVMAYLFWNKGLAVMGAGRTSLFLNLVPVSAMAIEAALGRPPSAIQMAGGVVVLGAVSVAMLPARTRAVSRA